MTDFNQQNSDEGSSAAIPREKLLRQRDKAVERLLVACEGVLDSHRKRAKDYPYLTLNEEGAISDLRLRLIEFEDANQAVNRG